jgi:hypothetical protein
MNKTIDNITLLRGDCLKVLPTLADNSIDAIICDLPIYIADAKSVLSWLFAKPLRDRLTAEEKERVRKMYKEAVEGKCELEKMQPQNTYAKNSIAMRIGVNMGCILALESIFGADFFKEEE